MPSRTSPAPSPLPPRVTRRVAVRPGRPGRRVREPRPRSGRDRELRWRSDVPRWAPARSPVYRTAVLQEAATSPRSALFPGRHGRAKAPAGERLEDDLPGRLPVVPRQPHLAHEVRARRLEPLVAAQDAGEPGHAPLAPDPAHLDRLGDDGHV